MHSPDYIKIITEAASQLKINAANFSENWAIKLSKSGTDRFIIGYTFPLNDSACYKIARNKNLCSEILSDNDIPNIPHHLLFSPTILKKRHAKKFIAENGFPILIKKNNSSGGDGVFFIANEPELEDVLSAVYHTDSTVCLSPFRNNIREYRNIVLNGECLITYEKLRPFISGDGKKTILQLLSEFKSEKLGSVSKCDNFINNSLSKRFNEVPEQNEKILLQWKHNATEGTKYEIVNNAEMQKLSIKAANAINANFVSVDISNTDKFGFEIMEVNASVVLHQFASTSVDNYSRVLEIYKLALQSLFTE
jgi:glutathione synthase/RimK-type ligase-like ATP-grasp enzyme